MASKKVAGTPLSSLGEPVLAQAHFRARESLQTILNEHQMEEEDLASDHECEEVSGSFQTLQPASTSFENNQESSQPPRLSRRARSTLRDREKRRAKRLEDQKAKNTLIKQFCFKKRSRSSAQSIPSSIKYRKDFVPSKPGWKAKPESHALKKEHSLEELVEVFGMEVVSWDGLECRPIVDADGIVVGLLGAMPKANDWEKVCFSAEQAIDQTRARVHVPKKHKNHRRGAFPALAVGLSHGGGQGKPGILKNGGHNTPILTDLVHQPCIRRIAGLSNSLFQCFAPRLHEYYMKTLDGLCEWSPQEIRRNYQGNAFAAITMNLGPRTVTYPHRDWANLSWGWCSISALGDFDADKGGHMVLWDLGLAIRFPRGSCIIIPSAMIRHSNASVGNSETRYSIAQYSASGLFRWVENGFMTDKDWLAQASMADRVSREEAQKTRWEDGLNMLSHISELMKEE